MIPKSNKKIKITINDCYEWTVQLVDISELPNKTDGIALYNERKILVRNDLDIVTTRCVLRHELTHAILCCQGRWSQKHFNQEEVCEFVGFQLPIINKIMKKIEENIL